MNFFNVESFKYEKTIGIRFRAYDGGILDNGILDNGLVIVARQL